MLLFGNITLWKTVHWKQRFYYYLLRGKVFRNPTFHFGGVSCMPVGTVEVDDDVTSLLLLSTMIKIRFIWPITSLGRRTARFSFSFFATVLWRLLWFSRKAHVILLFMFVCLQGDKRWRFIGFKLSKNVSTVFVRSSVLFISQLRCVEPRYMQVNFYLWFTHLIVSCDSERLIASHKLVFFFYDSFCS